MKRFLLVVAILAMACLVGCGKIAGDDVMVLVDDTKTEWITEIVQLSGDSALNLDEVERIYFSKWNDGIWRVAVRFSNEVEVEEKDTSINRALAKIHKRYWYVGD